MELLIGTIRFQVLINRENPNIVEHRIKNYFAQNYTHRLTYKNFLAISVVDQFTKADKVDPQYVKIHARYYQKR